MAFNPDELILDRVRYLTFGDLSTGQMLFRLSQLEEPSLTTSAEGEEVTDAVGALITTLYRSKRATFSAQNSLISLGLAAAQYGTKKEIASADKKIVDYAYEIIDVAKGTSTVTLKNEAVEDIQYIYSLVSGGIGDEFKAGAAASKTEFVFAEDNKTITVPTDFEGKLFVEYQYEAEEAVRVKNNASDFPEAGRVVIYVIFRDKCNENLKYAGKIICPKAKLNPESVELSLTSTGKHSFEFTMFKDYCAEEGDDELFEIIVSK